VNRVSLASYIASAATAPVHTPTGVIIEVVGLIVEVGGLKAGVGDMLRVLTSGPAPLDLEVIGFRAGRLLATPLGPVDGVRPGARVTHSTRGASFPVGPSMLGRIFDAFGDPLDERPAPSATSSRSLRSPPPPATSRKPIDKPFVTGVRAVDGMLTLGQGQRVGIFAGSGVGKTTLLGMICRSSQADVNVIGLVGERGREVNDFLRTALGEEGLARSVVIVATSDQPPLVRTRAAEAATAVAEHFRDQGKNVLLVMDSVTRFAMSLREAALASGEPPATKGYPPSVFAALPRLLERTGTSSGRGIITALYTVLVEGDDLSDPIADAVRGILDGHVVLSRKLAERGHFPAIDVLQSVSRLAPVVASAAQVRAAAAVRDFMGAYREAADLIQVGAYVPGSDARVDTACRLMPSITAFLQQNAAERALSDVTLQKLMSLSGGNA
jgi:flagellum-specific ATP synthase